LPLLASVAVCATLVTPTDCLPKERLKGQTCSPGTNFVTNTSEVPLHPPLHLV
jgi:hypothetical protein